MNPGTANWNSVRVRPEAALLFGTHGSPPSAAATVDSHRGIVHASWAHQFQTSDFRLNVTIPAGAEAHVHVPKLFGEASVIQESDRHVWSDDGHVSRPLANDGVQFLHDDGNFVAFVVGCGQYFFHVGRSSHSIE